MGNQIKGTLSQEQIAARTMAAQQGVAEPSGAAEREVAQRTPLILNAPDILPAFTEEAPDLSTFDDARLMVLTEALGNYATLLQKAHDNVQPDSFLNPRMDLVETRKATYAEACRGVAQLQMEFAEELLARTKAPAGAGTV